MEGGRLKALHRRLKALGGQGAAHCSWVRREGPWCAAGADWEGEQSRVGVLEELLTWLDARADACVLDDWPWERHGGFKDVLHGWLLLLDCSSVIEVHACRRAPQHQHTAQRQVDRVKYSFLPRLSETTQECVRSLAACAWLTIRMSLFVLPHCSGCQVYLVIQWGGNPALPLRAVLFLFSLTTSEWKQFFQYSHHRPSL